MKKSLTALMALAAGSVGLSAQSLNNTDSRIESLDINNGEVFFSKNPWKDAAKTTFDYDVYAWNPSNGQVRQLTSEEADEHVQAAQDSYVFFERDNAWNSFAFDKQTGAEYLLEERLPIWADDFEDRNFKNDDGWVLFENNQGGYSYLEDGSISTPALPEGIDEIRRVIGEKDGRVLFEGTDMKGRAHFIYDQYSQTMFDRIDRDDLELNPDAELYDEFYFPNGDLHARGERRVSISANHANYYDTIEEVFSTDIPTRMIRSGVAFAADDIDESVQVGDYIVSVLDDPEMTVLYNPENAQLKVLANEEVDNVAIEGNNIAYTTRIPVPTGYANGLEFKTIDSLPNAEIPFPINSLGRNEDGSWEPQVVGYQMMNSDWYGEKNHMLVPEGGRYHRVDWKFNWDSRNWEYDHEIIAIPDNTILEVEPARELEHKWHMLYKID